MTEIIVQLDTGHAGTIHDCQLDYYGKKLATTSSDNTIKIWDISTNQNSSKYDNNYNIGIGDVKCGSILLAELKAHEGPVWRVAWAHPKFGGIIASCSYDKRVIIWREVRQNEWQIVYTYEDHTASVNSIEWASWEYGLQLACAASDGYVSILTYKPGDNTWSKKHFYAHPNGVNGITWNHPNSSVIENIVGGKNTNAGNVGVGVGAGVGAGVGVGVGVGGGCENLSFKVATGGSDNQIKIWKYDEGNNKWIESCRLEDKGGHKDWVRDVSWRPNIGLSSNYIASCSEDEFVIIWYQESNNAAWKHLQAINMHAPVWRVSWSPTGSVLAVASGENVVTLFKEGIDGKFEMITSLDNNNDPNEEIHNYNNNETDAGLKNKIHNKDNNEALHHNSTSNDATPTNDNVMSNNLSNNNSGLGMTDMNNWRMPAKMNGIPGSSLGAGKGAGGGANYQGMSTTGPPPGVSPSPSSINVFSSASLNTYAATPPPPPLVANTSSIPYINGTHTPYLPLHPPNIHPSPSPQTPQLPAAYTPPSFDTTKFIKR